MRSEFKEHIIWIGPFYNNSAHISIADSPAAQKWQLALIDAIYARNCLISIIGYSPKRFFPFGPIKSKIKYSLRNNFIFGLDFLNVPYFRSITLRNSLVNALTDHVDGKVLVTYNSSKWLEDAMLTLKRKSDFKWVCIVADNVAPINADAYIFLSWGYYNRFNGSQPKLHLDGAIYKNETSYNSITKSDSKVLNLMYSGTFTKWGGLEWLIKAFININDPNIRLKISGKGDFRYFKKYYKLDKRIQFFNFLNENDLFKEYNSTDIFINPRPISISGNENNFPSKLFDYLAFNKPVISTLTDGLSPIYRNILFLVEDETVDSLCSTLNKVIEDFRMGTHNYNHSNKNKLLSWDDQAARFLNFISNLY